MRITPISPIDRPRNHLRGRAVLSVRYDGVKTEHAVTDLLTGVREVMSPAEAWIEIARRNSLQPNSN